MTTEEIKPFSANALGDQDKHPRWDWSESATSLIYRDDDYAVIWGRYRNDDGTLGKNKCLGVRWMGEVESRNFPVSWGKRAWIVEPRVVEEGILMVLLKDTLLHNDGRGDVGKIRDALKEIAERKFIEKGE